MSKRLAHIDSMRGIAALAVIYCHVSEYSTAQGLVSSPVEQALFWLLDEQMSLGKIAVTVFFAISGFVIPYSLLKPTQRPLTAFLISRTFRLYPAYWMSLLAGLLFLFMLKNRPIEPAMLIANITMLQQFIGQPSVMGIYWTLQVEIVFYVLCALLFVAGWLTRPHAVLGAALAFLAVAVALSCFRFHYDLKLPVALPLALCVMFWGLSLRFLFAERVVAWRPVVIAISAALIVCVPVISLLAYNKDMGFHETWHKYVLTYYIALALFYFGCRATRFATPTLAYLGAISYSVYLFGEAAQEAVFYFFGNSIGAWPAHVAILLTMALTVAVASIVYKFVEAPAIAAGRALISRISQRLDEPSLKAQGVVPALDS